MPIGAGLETAVHTKICLQDIVAILKRMLNNRMKIFKIRVCVIGLH